MFKPLRRKKIVTFTIWLLVAAFSIWGVGSVAGTARNYAGIIFAKKISPQEYQRSYSAVFNSAKMRYGDQLSKMQKFLDLEAQAWDRLILLYYAKKKRIKVRNKDVIERIASIPSFQSEGVFNEEAYNYIVQNVFGITPRDFEESIREDIIISKIIEPIQKNISITEKEIENAYKIKNEKANISYTLIETESFKKSVAIEAAELKPFYDTHKSLFRTQPEANICYVKIPFKEDTSGEKESTEDLAQQINDYLNTGDDFSALAEKHNLTFQETGAFSFGSTVPGVGPSYPFSLTAFGLSKERPNGIVEEKDAFYVMQLKEKIDPYIPSFEEVKKDVETALRNNKAQVLANGAAENYANILKSGESTMEELSNSIGVDMKKQADIVRENYVEGIGLNANFTTACFRIKENEFAGPVKVEKGYAIIRLDKLNPIEKGLFEKEKKAFTEKLLEEKKKKAIQAFFVELKKQANLKSNI